VPPESTNTSPNSAAKPATAEHGRLSEPWHETVQPWRKWGPYMLERAWGTVREDYSPDGDAWNYLTHEMARSKAYRWGEDGIAGLCDRFQLLCLGFAFWNGRDPILKERMFGLTPNEGNRGEDAKEYWFYLDSTPTHSYMKMLYKYPQAEYPYRRLIEENRARNGAGPEFELLDTGIFDEDRYFDIFVEYAKAAPEDICVRVEICNRGPEAAEIHVLPQLWFRNIWAWYDPAGDPPTIQPSTGSAKFVSLLADDTAASPLTRVRFPYKIGRRYLYGDAGGEPLFTDNETNAPAVYGYGHYSRSHFTKDAFHRYIVDGETKAVNPAQTGSKAGLHYTLHVPAKSSTVLRLRLSPESLANPLDDVDATVDLRRREADEFYGAIHPPRASDDEKMIQRQAFAGLLWGKAVYIFDVNAWLDGDNPKYPPPASRMGIRNDHWRHLNSMRIMSLPDKWEYPWFAAWDLAFHAVALAIVDPEFAKENLWLLLFEQFQHPNGQIPAYEWEFSDLNPPVQAWACWTVYEMDRSRTGRGDLSFLERCFHKLLINFAWWVNRVDSEGNNVFEGGFLGLDNIQVIDRSEPLPNGAILEQSDGTGWMAMYCLHLMRIALELAKLEPVYEDLATKFFEHFLYVGAALDNASGRDCSLWDEKDGFFYDVLRLPGGEFHSFRVRSLVGLIPMLAFEVLDEEEDLAKNPAFLGNVKWFVENRPDLARGCFRNVRDDSRIQVLSVLTQERLLRILQRLWDPNEFLSPAGIRSLSKYHQDHPFEYAGRQVRYEPAEADSKIKGGNSNWRGPVWFPASFLILEAMEKFECAMGAEVALTDADGHQVRPGQMAQEIANRLISIFSRGADGSRRVYGGDPRWNQDPNWRDLILFFEYFHGDTGCGLGASHQTGWTALVANLIDRWRR
jgi:hypothetical protein